MEGANKDARRVKRGRAVCACARKKVAVTLPSKAAKFFAFVLQIAKLPIPGLPG
jgi:hypothetical protein